MKITQKVTGNSVCVVSRSNSRRSSLPSRIKEDRCWCWIQDVGTFHSWFSAMESVPLEILYPDLMTAVLLKVHFLLIRCHGIKVELQNSTPLNYSQQKRAVVLKQKSRQTGNKHKHVTCACCS